jgi:hypothetical protein
VKRPPPGGRRPPGGIVDQRVTTTTSGQTPRALLRSSDTASAVDEGQGAARGSRPGAEKAPQRELASAPRAVRSAGCLGSHGQGEPREGFRLATTPTRLAAAAGGHWPRRRASARAEDGPPVWHRRVGAESVWTLKRRQSPWKDRVTGRWQRRLVTTDSSAEQSLEVGCFVRFRRAPTPAHLGGCRRSATEIPWLRPRAPGGSSRAAGRDLSRATRGG